MRAEVNHSGLLLLLLCQCLCLSVARVAFIHQPTQRLHGQDGLRLQDNGGLGNLGRKPALRMSAYGDNDADDPVVRRVEAIMEVTPLHIIVKSFESAYEGEPAQKPSDRLEALLDKPCVDGAGSGVPVGDNKEKQEEGATTRHTNQETRTMWLPDPAPSAGRPEVSGFGAAPTPWQPEIPVSSTWPASEDAARILQRAQQMSRLPQEEAAAVIARVNAMMREQERSARGDRLHTPPP